MSHRWGDCRLMWILSEMGKDGERREMTPPSLLWLWWTSGSGRWESDVALLYAARSLQPQGIEAVPQYHPKDCDGREERPEGVTWVVSVVLRWSWLCGSRCELSLAILASYLCLFHYVHNLRCLVENLAHSVDQRALLSIFWRGA